MLAHLPSNCPSNCSGTATSARGLELDASLRRSDSTPGRAVSCFWQRPWQQRPDPATRHAAGARIDESHGGGCHWLAATVTGQSASSLKSANICSGRAERMSAPRAVVESRITCDGQHSAASATSSNRSRWLMMSDARSPESKADSIGRALTRRCVETIADIPGTNSEYQATQPLWGRVVDRTHNLFFFTGI